jgi:hypothetical protein
MLQLSLRTLGGTSINTGTAALGQSLGTLTK